MSKRPSIASLAPRKANASNLHLADEKSPPQLESGGTPVGVSKEPAPYKAVLSKVDDATHKQIRRLAIDEGVPVGDLQIEAINLLFRSRGLPEIAVRVTPNEAGRKRIS